MTSPELACTLHHIISFPGEGIRFTLLHYHYRRSGTQSQGPYHTTNIHIIIILFVIYYPREEGADQGVIGGWRSGTEEGPHPPALFCWLERKALTVLCYVILMDSCMRRACLMKRPKETGKR